MDKLLSVSAKTSNNDFTNVFGIAAPGAVPFGGAIVELGLGPRMSMVNAFRRQVLRSLDGRVSAAQAVCKLVGVPDVSSKLTNRSA